MGRFGFSGLALTAALLFSLSSTGQDLSGDRNLVRENANGAYPALSLPDFNIRLSTPFSMPINSKSSLMAQDYLEIQGRASMFHSGISATPLVNGFEPENTLGVVINPELDLRGPDPLAVIRGLDSARLVPRQESVKSGNELLFSSPYGSHAGNTFLYGTPFLPEEPSKRFLTDQDTSLSVPAQNPFGDPFPATDSSMNREPATENSWNLNPGIQE